MKYYVYHDLTALGGRCARVAECSGPRDAREHALRGLRGIEGERALVIGPDRRESYENESTPAGFIALVKGDAWTPARFHERARVHTSERDKLRALIGAGFWPGKVEPDRSK